MVVIDPVLGDNGNLYSTMDQGLVEGMKHLVTKADIITPNFTEVSLLLGEEYKQTTTDEEIKEWVKRLSDMGPDIVVVTSVPDKEKDKVEFLCNECCWFGCYDRKNCYEIVSRQNLGEDCPDHVCVAPDSQSGYRFSKAMENPAFISVDDIRNTYMPMGFSNFKIEGRGLGSALVLEFLLYYMIKPEYQIHVREDIYLDNMLDIF